MENRTDPASQVLLTEALYWSMLESGLALIACCLPTLNKLFSLPSVRSFVASIRSLRSMGSGRSGSRRGSGRERGEVADPLTNDPGIALPSKPSASFSTRHGSRSEGHAGQYPADQDGFGQNSHDNLPRSVEVGRIHPGA